MDRGTFQSCSAASCHGRTWTDDKAQVWTGVPLYYIAGRIDDEIKHGDDSYNHKAVDEGYTLQVVASDGFTVTVDGARARQDKNILVAYLVNDNPLDDKYFPLRLVGRQPEGQRDGGQDRQDQPHGRQGDHIHPGRRPPPPPRPSRPTRQRPPRPQSHAGRRRPAAPR